MLRRLLLALTILCCVSATASTARADEPERVEIHDRDAHPPDGSASRMFWTGAAVTGVWYGGAVGFSYLWPSAPGADDLRIPVAGPWMALADTGCADTNPNCGTFGVVLRAILTTIGAVGQTGGVLVMMEGLFLETAQPGSGPRRRRAPKKQAKSSPRVMAAPMVTQSGAMGFSLSGRF